MLERDVIDKKPNVTFDDIAELNTAKTALKEAILLPLLMPSVFVVSIKSYVIGNKETMERSIIIWSTRNREDNVSKGNSNNRQNNFLQYICCILSF